MTLLHPTYSPNIVTFGFIVQNRIVWEVEDNYQKQTYRNRCYICTDKGRSMMNIPIRHVGGDQGRQKYKDVLLDNSYPWQDRHWKTLQAAYRSSPFFEFYEDDLQPLYTRKYKFLLDYNLKVIKAICDCLHIQMPEATTAEYVHTPHDARDARFLVNAKAEPLPLGMQYQQVFGERHGFVPNLSVLDLLFNLGTTALMALEGLDLSYRDT